MHPTRTAGFRKQRTCPSAESLLGHGGAAAGERQSQIASHLAGCDFCGAEMQLLSLYPPHACGAPAADPGAMPWSLRRLAEELLTDPSLNRAKYADAIYEIERMTLTDA